MLPIGRWDAGLALRNPRTGVVTEWVHAWWLGEWCDRSGERLRWVYLPTLGTVRKVPELKNYRLTLTR